MNWENINIDSNKIETVTDKAVLINCPNKSKYKGYSFWHPKKLCRQVGKSDYLTQIGFTDNWKFELKQYGKGKYNFRDIINDASINPEELKEIFGFSDTTEVLDDLKD